MNCEQYQEYISQFIDGELESAGEARLFGHLGSCEQCRSFLKDAMSLRAELFHTQAVTVPESLSRRIVAKSNSLPHALLPKQRHFRWIGQGRMISLRFVGFALVISILASVGITSLWYHSNVAATETVVYVPTLPTVEVRGYIPSSSDRNN